MKMKLTFRRKLQENTPFMLELFLVIFIKNAYWRKTGSKKRI